jgi:DNA mismatch endonuclease (patch repair protein)
MADVLTKKQRSYNMSQIRGKDTKPEEIVRKYLFSKGLRYRKNDKRYPGHPDIVLPKYHTVVFVHGCFWHRHPGCRYASVPATNSEFWQKKFTRNVERDKEEQCKLREMGWKVLIVWECELKKDRRETTLNNLYSAITEK